MARQIHANLPNSEFVLIKDAAHIASIEQAEFFNAKMVEFLAVQS
jgi:pimeloyl-ACP methyl ester carboxylesterase